MFHVIFCVTQKLKWKQKKIIEINNRKAHDKYRNFQFLTNCSFHSTVYANVEHLQVPHGLFSEPLPHRKHFADFYWHEYVFLQAQKAWRIRPVICSKTPFGFWFTGTNWHENTRRQIYTSVQPPQLFNAGTKDGAEVGQLASLPHFSGTEQRDVKILLPTQMC